ncbi:MAG: hypothetical protein ACKODX_16500 [Gemmata sp.]
MKVFRGSDLTLLSSRIVFESTYRDGVRVQVNDSTGNGRDDLVVERASGPARFRAFDDNGVDGPFHDLLDDNGFDGINHEGDGDASRGANSGRG